MFVPQKCQYGLRALFELARHEGAGLVKTAAIAKAQAIPVRFLEVILSQLRRGGFVDSRRGSRGGYYLVRSPKDLTVGDVIRFMEGPIGPVVCVAGGANSECALYGDCVFLPMWRKVGEAMSEVYDGTTFQDLVDQDRERVKRYVPSYEI